MENKVLYTGMSDKKLPTFPCKSNVFYGYMRQQENKSKRTIRSRMMRDLEG